MQQHKSKRRTETEEKREAAVDTGPLPSKGTVCLSDMSLGCS